MTAAAPSTWRDGVEAGLTSLPIDPRWGGRGGSLHDTAGAFTAFAASGAPPALVFALGAQLWSVAMVLHRFAPDHLRDRWLVPLCAGECVAGHAMTEPATGSDAFALATTVAAAEGGDGGEVGDGTVVIDGVKTFVTNGTRADVFLVFATSARALGWAGIGAYLVERATPGVAVTTVDVLGPDDPPLAEVAFDACAVPAGNCIGAKTGMAMFTYAMELERSLLAAGQLGAIEAKLRASRLTVTGRVARAQYAALHARLATCAALVDRAVDRLDAGRSAALESASAKVATSELWSDVAVWTHHLAGAGVMLAGTGFAYDSVAAKIYSGTSELQREMIGRRMGLK